VADGEAPHERVAAATAAHQAAVAAWKQGLDGHLAGKVTSIADYDAKRAEYVAEHPEPVLGDDQAAAMLTPHGDDPVVIENRGWGARLMTAQDAANLPSLGHLALVPLEEAMPHVLTEVARDGWQVTHVTYGRDIAQQGGSSRATIVSVTFLLERAAG
jgi:hypothetical protein